MEKNKLDKKIQSALDKLISDEWFAGQTYKQFVLLVDDVDRSKIAEQFIDIAHDELHDHMDSLVSFAQSYGFSVPSTYNEMKKHADKEDIKLFEDCKKNENAEFYIGKGIEAENRAIKTYQKYFDDYEFAKDFPELKSIIKNNYYDEVDHLESLTFMKNSLEVVKQFD